MLLVAMGLGPSGVSVTQIAARLNSEIGGYLFTPSHRAIELKNLDPAAIIAPSAAGAHGVAGVFASMALNEEVEDMCRRSARTAVAVASSAGARMIWTSADTQKETSDAASLPQPLSRSQPLSHCQPLSRSQPLSQFEFRRKEKKTAQDWIDEKLPSQVWLMQT
mmetsp:Transcript_3135/g.5623  ORF Transcript_3135/g.5623 Transcript_3135/m.5623 type:complete len:164 (-) Transcript_3135:127-618(-)